MRRDPRRAGVLGYVVATRDTRVGGELLRQAEATNDPRQRAVVVEALLASAKTTLFSRFIGAETHGSRPALNPWRPATGDEAASYITFCVERLTREAVAADEVGISVKTSLGYELRTLVGFGLVDVVERTIARVHEATGGWPEAIESLGHFLEHDTASAAPDIADRVRRLIELLQPNTLPERIHDLVSNMPWDYPNGKVLDYDEQLARQLETVHGIAEDALNQTSALAEQLPRLCTGTQRWAAEFGEFIAARIASPQDWLQRIETAVCETDHDDRNFELLAGFLKGLSSRNADAVEVFKRQVAESVDLAPALPAICSHLGIVDTDIQLAADALRQGVLPPWPLRRWSFGGALSSLPPSAIAPLVDELVGRGSDGIPVAVGLIGMLRHAAKERLEDLRPQLLELATSIADQSLPPQSTMSAHHVEQIFKWLSNTIATTATRALALTLSRVLAADDATHETIDLLSPLLPELFARFPEIAWPLIGQQLVKPTVSAWDLRQEVTGVFASHRDGSRPPILSLPSDTLFAWCSAYPDEAPACAASMLPIL